MSDLEKRVVATLAAHDFRLEYQNTGARVGTIVCGCGNRYGLSDSHRAHVAERINYALAPVIAEAKAEALREAVSDFESSVGVGEFTELSQRGPLRWGHIEEAWEHQGPYMDWLRNRADKLVTE